MGEWHSGRLAMGRILASHFDRGSNGVTLASSTTKGDGDSDGDSDTAGVSWEIHAQDGGFASLGRKFDGARA